MNTEIFEYIDHKITFQLGNGDVMVNATEMAKNFGKSPYDCMRLSSTKTLITAIASKNRIAKNKNLLKNYECIV
ncbi:KilA-N domain-containing protein [Meridianimaribacter flavus]